MSELKRYDMTRTDCGFDDHYDMTEEEDGLYYRCSDIDPMLGEIAALKELMLEAADVMDRAFETPSFRLVISRLADRLREAAE